MSTEISHLEYKGYKGILKLSSKDNRLWGKICTPENPTTPIDGWGFAGDDIQEAEKIFRYQVERIISQKKENLKVLLFVSGSGGIRTPGTETRTSV